MKIMLQNRTMIVEQPRCIWAEPGTGTASGAVIASNLRRAPTLGKYPTMERAVEVLGELFDYQRAGKYNYHMPEK